MDAMNKKADRCKELSSEAKCILSIANNRGKVIDSLTMSVLNLL